MQFDGEIANLQNATSFQYKDIDDTIKNSRKHLQTWLNRFFVSLDEGGLICATEVLDFLDFIFILVFMLMHVPGKREIFYYY